MLRQKGLTLIELMIAMVVGLVITSAATALFLATSKTHRSTTQVATLLDNARLAVTFIERDLQLAGYWGYLGNPGLIRGIADTPDDITVTQGVSVTGMGSCDAKLAIRLQDSFQVSDGATLGSCLTDYLAGTDVLVVHRAETGAAVAAYDNNRLYVKVDHRFGHVFLGNTPPTATYATPNESRPVQLLIYYVSTKSDDPGVKSSLRRIYLDAGPKLVDEELVPGVEDLQIELGVDSDNDESVNAYVAPGAAGALANATRALRVSVLMHAAQPDIEYVDSEDYLDLGSAQKRVTANKTRRMQYAKTILLMNQE